MLSETKISDAAGRRLDDFDGFGRSVAGIGDLDGDGVPDLAVGAYRDDDGATDSGAVWILFMNAAGGVRTGRKISNTQGGSMGMFSGNCCGVDQRP